MRKNGKKAIKKSQAAGSKRSKVKRSHKLSREITVFVDDDLSDVAYEKLIDDVCDVALAGQVNVVTATQGPQPLPLPHPEETV